MRKRVLPFVFGMLPFCICYGQQMDNKMLPNAGGGQNQSLGSLAAPNLFDGSANINIPIHDYGSFGISLSYNTKGVPVQELSSPVGTHWVLNAGGSITRNVKDIPDEANQHFDATPGVNDMDYSLLGRAHVYAAAGSQPNRQYWDGENDEFNVSAGTLQFTFKLGKDGYIFTYPENRYKINVIAAPSGDPNGVHIFDKFEITDNDGTKYTFGTKAADMTGSIAFGDVSITGGAGWSVDYYYTPQWFLDKVEFNDGQAINYSYEYMDYPAEGSGTEGLSLYRANTFNYKAPPGSLDPVWDNDPGPVFMASLQENTHILASVQYPDNTTVNFVFDQGAGYQPSCMKSIKQIEVYQGDNCIKYKLNKAYLQQGANYSPLAVEVPFDNGCNFNPETGISQRMILKGIDILSCDETETQTYYEFEYSAVAPPSRWGNNVDFFGYCNYITDNLGNSVYIQPTSSKSPFNTTIGANDPCNRAVITNPNDVGIMAALCLTKVKNAYGASLTFQYELHSGLTSVTDNLPTPNPDADHLFLGKNAADGLRLYRTIAEDKYRPNSKLITTYTYSGGQFFLNGGYYAYPTIKDANGVIKQYKGTSNWVSAHQLINGSNHGYSQVTVTSSDNSGNMLSKEIHYFSNFNENGTLNYKTIDPNANQKHYFQAPYTDKQYILDWKVGLPVKTETFDKSGNITSRTTNNYDLTSANDFTSAETGLGINEHRMRVSVITVYGSPNNPILGLMDPNYNLATDNYIPFRGKALLISTTTEKFVNNSSSISDVAEYSYDSRYNLAQTKTRNSRGEYFLTKNIYNYNVTGSYTLTTMTGVGLEKVISTERWKQGSTTPSGDQLFDASITTYNYTNGILLTQKVQNLQSLAPVSYNDYTNSGTSLYNRILTAYNSPTQPVTNFKVASEVLQYDERNNPVETQVSGQNDYVSMIWDANYNKSATANARLQDIGFTSFEGYPVNATANTEVTDGRFKYKFVGVQGMAGSVSGGVIYNLSPATYIKSPILTHGQNYEMTVWSNGIAPQVTGGGITLQFTLAYQKTGWNCYRATFTPTSDGRLNFYSPSSIKLDEIRLFPAGATMTNAVYAPFLGATSSTDPTGRITYYEYDKMGRQYISRDQEGKIISKKDYHLAQ